MNHDRVKRGLQPAYDRWSCSPPTAASTRRSFTPRAGARRRSSRRGPV